MQTGDPICRRLPHHCNLAVLLAVLASVPGCGNTTSEPFSRAAVDGTVTVSGVPVEGAIIRFIPTGQTPGPKTSFPVHEGKFETTVSDGPPVGTHRVEIESTDEGDFAHDDEEALERLSKLPRRPIQPPRATEPNHLRSTLTVELLAPQGDRSQVLEFSLSGRKR